VRVCRVQPAEGAQKFSLCAVDGGRHLALSDGVQVALWSVQLPEGPDGARPTEPLPSYPPPHHHHHPQRQAPAEVDSDDDAVVDAAAAMVTPSLPTALEVRALDALPGTHIDHQQRGWDRRTPLRRRVEPSGKDPSS
jgi:hypothetical protein